MTLVEALVRPVVGTALAGDVQREVRRTGRADGPAGGRQRPQRFAGAGPAAARALLRVTLVGPPQQVVHLQRPCWMIFKSCLSSSELVWARLGSSGLVWACLDLSGLVWTCLDLSVLVFPCPPLIHLHMLHQLIFTLFWHSSRISGSLTVSNVQFETAWIRQKQTQ